MSLINQALRKAQRDRAPSRMPQSGAEAGMSTGYASPQQRGPGLIIGLIVGIAVLIGLVAGLTIILLQKEPAPAPSQTQIASTIAAATPQAPAATAPTATAPAAPVTAAVEAPPAPAPAESPVTGSPAPSILAELGAARAEVEEQAEAAAIQARTPSSPSVRTWLSTAQVAGVRISERGNKAIINGKTYQAGEMIDYELELEVLSIQQGQIILRDANRKEYKLSY
ncbi:MAG: hypothetical protein AAGC73_09290 [Verrucomicrobiota bacterium]